MALQRVLQFAHSLMEGVVEKGDITVDGTCGNGHDTLFLAQLVGENGHVYGFDIQQDAIHHTEERLREHGVDSRTTLIQDSHSTINEHLAEEHKQKVKAGIFNLGYLPGSDKSIVTKPEETIASVERLLEQLISGGIIVLVVYHGHPGGKEEKEALLEYVQGLDQKEVRALQYGFINQRNTPPFIIALEKQ
ncbi:methyltransferase domain-containing protein [Halobacillus litoralis]|uniref:class I SAM-dependent methyltransferase n=1 Tax=Halobacillus litoralis TaxID=45668 RepID=UPI001CD7A3D6|nr:class I SAM-dependent methyltransferase [Halobacillus litoralis]MCA0972847.1 methyltransferase domain-containing protein [Halobacillus litoralis]